MQKCMRYPAVLYLQVREAYRRKLESAQRDVAELSRAVAIMQNDPKTGLRVTPGEERTCNRWYVYRS